MPKSLKLVLVLTIICIISATMLSYVYNEIAAPIIKERTLAQSLEILNEMLPGADDYQFITAEDSDKVLYYVATKNNEPFGIAIPTSAVGFGGSVDLMVICEMNGQISTVKVMAQLETPGYGDRILTEPWFLEQYDGMNLASDNFDLGSTVDALAGATVTSKAANKAITKAAEFFRDTISGGN